MRYAQYYFNTALMNYTASKLKVRVLHILRLFNVFTLKKIESRITKNNQET